MATPPLERVKALLAALPREDQESLSRFLYEMLGVPEEVEARPRHVATLKTRARGRRKAVTYTFRNEWIRCGKPSCKCANGASHGPYTYKYWREDGRLRKQYVGKSGAGSTRPGGRAPAARDRGSSGASSSGPAPRP